MSQAIVDNFVREMQTLQKEASSLNAKYAEFQTRVVEFCNGDANTARLMFSMLNEVVSGKMPASDVYINVDAKGVVIIGRKSEPKAEETQKESPKIEVVE